MAEADPMFVDNARLYTTSKNPVISTAIHHRYEMYKLEAPISKEKLDSLSALFFSFRPGKCVDDTLIMARQLPSKSFPVYLSCFVLR
jgi:hypothetical protein